ncbi:MAG: amidohydrolase family protein [Elsteraceae bacterium]
MRPILLLAIAVLAFGGASARAAEPLPIFDAHLHYSHDAWGPVPPERAVAILREAGLKRAMVSSSDDEGTQKLFALAPDLVVPVLRPYRKRGDLSTWVKDETVLTYLSERLAKYKYAGIGEFHVYGADADLPVVRRMVQMAKERGLFLHLHGDAEAVERVFAQDPSARILWAHSGFDRPENVRATLQRHAKLWADLAFRTDHASGGVVDPAWRALFEAFPDRFMVGTDTFTPERWHYVVDHAAYTRKWLADLPTELAERIAYRNGEAFFAHAPSGG